MRNYKEWTETFVIFPLAIIAAARERFFLSFLQDSATKWFLENRDFIY